MSTIIVTGGAGFIGTRLVDLLLGRGHTVRIVDKEKSSAFPDLSITCDVRDLDGLREACAGCDVIYNLAAEHRDDVRPASLYDEVNVGGARNTCAAAEAHGIPSQVFVSSVAVYGFSERPADEEAPKAPFNDYGRTKLAAEEVYREWQGADPRRSLTIVRPTVVFGEGNRGNVYNLLHQIARGPFVMIGSGRNKKSMAYVENAAAFLAHVSEMPDGVHVYNYVDKPDFDMNELVQIARETMGEAGGRPPLRVPYAAGWLAGAAADLVAGATGRSLPVSLVRVRKFCASTVFSADRLRDTGFSPPVALKEALRRTIQHEFGSA